MCRLRPLYYSAITSAIHERVDFDCVGPLDLFKRCIWLKYIPISPDCRTVDTSTSRGSRPCLSSKNGGRDHSREDTETGTHQGMEQTGKAGSDSRLQTHKVRNYQSPQSRSS